MYNLIIATLDGSKYSFYNQTLEDVCRVRDAILEEWQLIYIEVDDRIYQIRPSMIVNFSYQKQKELDKERPLSDVDR